MEKHVLLFLDRSVISKLTVDVWAGNIIKELWTFLLVYMIYQLRFNVSNINMRNEFDFLNVHGIIYT